MMLCVQRFWGFCWFVLLVDEKQVPRRASPVYWSRTAANLALENLEMRLAMNDLVEGRAGALDWAKALLER